MVREGNIEVQDHLDIIKKVADELNAMSINQHLYSSILELEIKLRKSKPLKQWYISFLENMRRTIFVYLSIRITALMKEDNNNLTIYSLYKKLHRNTRADHNLSLSILPHESEEIRHAYNRIKKVRDKNIAHIDKSFIQQEFLPSDIIKLIKFLKLAFQEITINLPIEQAPCMCEDSEIKSQADQFIRHFSRS